MVIIGHKSILLVSEQVKSLCSACSSMQQHEIQIYQKYVHLFWIPFLPAGKTGYCVCKQCEKIEKQDEMNNSLQNQCYNLKQQVKAPIWMYGGAILLLLLYLYLTWNEKNG